MHVAVRVEPHLDPQDIVETEGQRGPDLGRGDDQLTVRTYRIEDEPEDLVAEALFPPVERLGMRG